MKILKKIFNKKNSWVLLPALSGFMLFLAYPPQDLWFLVFVALIPLFWFLFSEKTSEKQAFWGGTIAGSIFMGGLFVWFFHTAPFEWLGVETKKEYIAILIMVIFSWALSTFSISMFFSLFAWLSKKMIKRSPGIFSLLITVPSLWIIFEYLRAWGFEFVWLGKETFFGNHWTFGNLAYALHKVPLLIQSADIWGIYGISFLIILINTILFLFGQSIIRKKRLSLKQLIVYSLALIIVFAFLIIYGNNKLKTETRGETREIALMQTNFISSPDFNPYYRKEVLKIVLDMFQAKNNENPDFVIAPEGLGIVSAVGKTNIAKHILGSFWRPGQIYLENKKIVEEDGKNKSRLFYYDLEQENPLGYYDKKLLIPGGDFLPYITKLILTAFSYSGDFEKRLYQKGEISTPTVTPKGVIGGTICSSILSPQIHREMANKGAEFLIVVSSDSPFHGSKPLLAQNLAMSKLRAVENRRYFAQATNMGYSFLLDSEGRIIIKSENFGNEILFIEIALFDKKTPYTKHGDWFIFLAFLVLSAELSYPQALRFLLQKKK